MSLPRPSTGNELMRENKFSVSKEYRRLRKLKWPAKLALTSARVNTAFKAAELCGLVLFEVRPDEDAELDEFVDDNASNTTRNKFAKRMKTEGVWGIVVSVKCGPCKGWRVVDSVWGFLGNDHQDSLYDVDIKSAALDAAGIECPFFGKKETNAPSV